MTNTGAIALKEIPEKLIVIGTDIIGQARFWSRLGAEVTVVEYLDRVMPGADDEIAKKPSRLQETGPKLPPGQKVTGVERIDGHVKLFMEPAKGGDEKRWKPMRSSWRSAAALY